MTSGLLAQAVTPVLSEGPGLGRSLFAVIVVFGLLALCIWLLRRGGFGVIGRRGPQAVQIETAVPLGERRQLVVVNVEGRRLLLGLTSAQVSFITELTTTAPSFASTLDSQLSAEPQD